MDGTHYFSAMFFLIPVLSCKWMHFQYFQYKINHISSWHKICSGHNPFADLHQYNLVKTTSKDELLQISHHTLSCNICETANVLLKVTLMELYQIISSVLLKHVLTLGNMLLLKSFICILALRILICVSTSRGSTTFALYLSFSWDSLSYSAVILVLD